MDQRQYAIFRSALLSALEEAREQRKEWLERMHASSDDRRAYSSARTEYLRKVSIIQVLVTLEQLSAT